MDVVINHMCGSGGGEGTHSSCGSWFSASKRDFPSVPFSKADFNDNKCRTGSGEIENYGDVNQVMNVTRNTDVIFSLLPSFMSQHFFTPFKDS